MPRKVLLLTYHFPPSSAVAVYRMLGLVRYLPRHGWQPLVVAPPRVPWEPEDQALLLQVPPGTPVERVPFADGLLGKVQRRVAPLGHWLPRAWSAAQRMVKEHRPDAVITSSPPGCVHLLGLWMQARYRLPWVACFRDPWITNHRDKKMTLVNRLELRYEAKVMQHADAIVANTPLNLEGFREAYPKSAAKMVAILNGFDPEKFATTASWQPSDTITLLHAGELYYGRDPRAVLDAMQSLRQLPDAEQVPLRAHFLGRSTEGLFDLPKEVQSRGLDDVVTTQGQVPYADALEQMVRADLLLLIHTPGYRVGVPAKLYEYLGARRPILALAEPDGDVAGVLRRSGVLHRIVPHHDPAAIQRALVELCREIRQGQPAVNDPAALLGFTRERMAERFAQCLDACVDGGDLAQPALAQAMAP